MKQVGDRRDDDRRDVTPWIESRDQQSNSHCDEKRSAIGNQMCVKRTRLGHSRYQAEEPDRRREEHFYAVDKRHRAEDPEHDFYPSRMRHACTLHHLRYPCRPRSPKIAIVSAAATAAIVR